MKKTAVLTSSLSWFFLVSMAQPKYVIFNQNDFYGLKNENNDVLIPAKFDSLGWTEGLQLPVNNEVIGYYDGHWGLISIKNKIISKPNYYSLWPIHKDLIIASVKGRFSNHIFYGAINSKGRAVIEFKYSSITKKGSSLIIAENRNGQNYFGLLSESNKPLLKTEYKKIRSFENDLFVFTDQNDQKGVISSRGNLLLEASLDNISEPVNGLSTIYKRGKQGLINVSGEIIVEPKYKSILISKDDDHKRVSFDQWAVTDASNKTLITFHCDSVSYMKNGCLVVYRNSHLEIFNSKNKSIFNGGSNSALIGAFNDNIVLADGHQYGAINTSGDLFIPFENDSLYATESYYYGKNRDKWTIWNKYGRKISKFEYDDIKTDRENLIAVKRKGYWGFIDFQGDEVIPLKFEEVSRFDDRIAKVTYLNSEGSINQFGEWISEPIYDEVDISLYGLSKGMLRRRIDLVGQTGNIVFQTYNHLKAHGAGFLETTDEGLNGLINKTGKILLYPEYDYISNILEGDKIFAKKGIYSVIISAVGEWEFYLSDRYEMSLGKSEQLYAVKIDGKYGFVDDQERLRIANRYDSVALFREGMAAIQLRGKWGFIDKSENIAVQPHYDEVSGFRNSLAVVREKSKYGIIDKTGVIVLPTNFDQITELSSGAFVVKKENKYGLLNDSGELIISAEYDYLQLTTDGLFIAKRRGKFGLLNDTGLFNIPLIYNEIIYAGDGLYLCMLKPKSY